MINEIRNNAEKLFNNTGYPTTSNEKWKYTDLKNFSSCKDKSDKTKIIAELDRDKLEKKFSKNKSEKLN